MKKPAYYRQCLLQKNVDGGVRKRVAYIPHPFCVVGRKVRLRLDDGTWDEGWMVVTAGEQRAAKYVEERERDYLKMRTVTDV